LPWKEVLVQERKKSGLLKRKEKKLRTDPRKRGGRRALHHGKREGERRGTHVSTPRINFHENDGARGSSCAKWSFSQPMEGRKENRDSEVSEGDLYPWKADSIESEGNFEIKAQR